MCTMFPSGWISITLVLRHQDNTWLNQCTVLTSFVFSAGQWANVTILTTKMRNLLSIMPAHAMTSQYLVLSHRDVRWLYTWFLKPCRTICCLLIHSDLVVLGRVPPWCSANDDPVNCTDDTADEIMERIVRSATQGPSQRTQPRERRRSRANRKSCESCQWLDKWPNL